MISNRLEFKPLNILQYYVIASLQVLLTEYIVIEH
jgi:hypothetical protein